MEILAISLLNGISFGMLLFVIASGLSLILGLMGIVNVAHGALFMIGGYIGVTVANTTNNFLFGALAGAFGAGIVGLFIERGFLRNLYKKELEQILVTFAFVYIITNLTIWIWGPFPITLVLPQMLTTSIPIGMFSFPIHRLILILTGMVLAFCLWWLQEKTKIGAIVRAGMDDAEMVSGLGINLRPITISLFVLGSFLAGLGGTIATPMLGGLNSDLGVGIIFVAIAVVIVGGIGSVQGVLAGALLIGVIDNLTATYFPLLSMFTVCIAIVLILVLRPTGLIGRKLGRQF